MVPKSLKVLEILFQCHELFLNKIIPNVKIPNIKIPKRTLNQRKNPERDIPENLNLIFPKRD
jgi:hypothetical protein